MRRAQSRLSHCGRASISLMNAQTPACTVSTFSRQHPARMFFSTLFLLILVFGLSSLFKLVPQPFGVNTRCTRSKVAFMGPLSWIAMPVEAVRIGVVGNLEGSIGEATQWAVDGFLVGIHEHNRNATSTAIGAVIRDNASDTIQVTVMNAGQGFLNISTLIPREMSNASTRLDGLALAIGPFATNAVLNASRIYNLPAFGLIPGDRGVFLQFNPSAALVTPVPDSEIAALVEEVVVRRQLKRIAVMTTGKHAFGNDVVPYLKTLLAEFGLTLVFHFEMQDPLQPLVPPSRGPESLQFRKLTEANAQVMFMLCTFFYETGSVVYQAMNALSFKGIFVTPAVTMPLMEGILTRIPLPSQRPPNTIVSALYFPLHNDLSYTVARSYRSAFTAATTGGFVNATTTLAQQDTTKTIAGNIGISGYVIARLVSAVVASQSANGPITGASLNEKLFSRRIFTIDDVNMGPFSPPCVGQQTSFCACNSGARAVYLGQFDAETRLVAIPGSQYAIPDGVCIPFGAVVRSPLVVLMATYNLTSAVQAGGVSADEEGSMGVLASAAFEAGHAAALVDAVQTPSTRTPIVLRQTYRTDEQRSDLEALQANRFITVAAGSVLTAPLNPSVDTQQNIIAAKNDLAVFIDPLMVGVPQRLDAGFQRRVIHTVATLDQELHALAKVLGQRGIALLTTAASDGDKVGAALKSSLHTFEHDTMGAVEHVPSTSTIAAALDAILAPAPGSVLLVNGIRTAADVHSLARYLQRGLQAAGITASSSSSDIVGAAVVLPFATVRVWYDVLTTAISDDARQRHVLFASSLPNWHPRSPTATASALLKDYHESLGIVRNRRLNATATIGNSSAPTLNSTADLAGPQSLLGFLTQRLLANIAERVPTQLTDATLLSTLYTVSVFVLDPQGQQPYVVGPYSDQSCASSSSSTVIDSTRCDMNIGARSVYVRSLASTASASFVFSDTAASNTSNTSSTASGEMGSFTFASGRVQYVPLPKSPGVSPIVIAFAAVGGTLLLGAIAALIVIRFLSGRNNRAAPKNAKVPFTIIFTDIQSSTSLWAAIPDVMGPALAAHHTIIRQLIAKHNGYEVKTIGDAFMIAFAAADDAVALAFDLQFAFLKSPAFASREIDEVYIDLELEKAAAAAQDESAGATNDDDDPLNNTKTLLDAEVLSSAPRQETAMDTLEVIPNRQRSTMDLSPEEYAAQWQGLRVRVGIHTGFGDIQKDPVTGGYDYYGTVVNTAARVEAAAHGGQVVMSVDTLQSLKKLPLLIGAVNAALATLYEGEGNDEHPLLAPKTVVPLGQAMLRGLTNPVSLYQLETVPRREFPPLRVEEGGGAEGEADHEQDRHGNEVSGDPHEHSRSGQGTGVLNSPPKDVLSVPSVEGMRAITPRSKPRDGHNNSGSECHDMSTSGGSSVSHRQRHVNPAAPFQSPLTPLLAMGVLGALVARVPAPRRAKELQRLAELWHLTIAFPPSSTNTTSTTSAGQLAIALGRGDACVGQCLEVLGKHIAPIAAKMVLNATTAGAKHHHNHHHHTVASTTTVPAASTTTATTHLPPIPDFLVNHHDARASNANDKTDAAHPSPLPIVATASNPPPGESRTSDGDEEGQPHAGLVDATLPGMMTTPTPTN